MPREGTQLNHLDRPFIEINLIRSWIRVIHMNNNNNIKRICVYCGSRSGTDEAYKAIAIAMGHAIAERGMELVYGAGSVGLMNDVK